MNYDKLKQDVKKWRADQNPPMKAYELAQKMGYQPKYVSQVICGSKEGSPQLWYDLKRVTKGKIKKENYVEQS